MINSNLQSSNSINLYDNDTEEVIRLDQQGFHYRGEFIADAGEAHRLMLVFLKKHTVVE